MAEYKHAMVDNGKGNKVVFPPFVTQKEMDIISKEFVVRDDDVFVVAYPKSGTTWMEQIVHLLANNGEQGDKVLSEAVPWVERTPNRYGDMENLLKSIVGRRFFRSHLPYALMPGIKTKAKYIYVARNPKDNAVSFYYHSCSKMNYEGSWEQFFDLYIKGLVGYGLFFDHVLDWWQASQQSPNILFVKYEDMKRDLEKAVLMVRDFTGITSKEELVKKVAEKSSFQSMAKNPKANLDWVPQKKGIPRHMRKGIVGDWRHHFSAQQNKIFDELYQEKMSKTNLTFEFE